MNENLVYYLDFIDTQWWFCVFKTLEKKIFKMTHDDHYHADFDWVYSSICWFMHSKSLSAFEAVYHSLLQMSTLSDCKTCVIWSFATDSWILNFISYCHHWFHSQTFKNQFRSRCSDNNHLQVFQEDEIHLWQRDLNSCWMSKSLFHSHHWLKHFNCINW